MGDESILAAGPAGKLPQQRPERMWGGPGSGASCAICGKTIGTEEVEFELQFVSDGGSGPASYHVHARCFAAWELERRDGGSNGHPLPRAENGGIMLGRERNTTTEGERG
jgi:hypothetical protein